MNEILRWLQRPDYQTGVALYERYGPNNALKILFRSGENTLTKNKLRDALTLLSTQALPAPEVVRPRVKVVESSTKPSQLKDAPPQVRLWVETRSKHYDEMKLLHGRLKLYPTDQERYEAAERIADLEQEIWGLWEKTKFYDEHLKVPEPKPLFTQDLRDRAALQRRLTNLRSYISRHSKNLAREADVIAWQTELAWVEERLADIDEDAPAKEIKNPTRSGAGTCIILAGNLNTGKSFYYEEIIKRQPAFDLIQIDRFRAETSNEDSARLQLMKHLVAAENAIYATTTANEIHTYAMEVIKNKFDRILTVKIECPFEIALSRFQAMKNPQVRAFDISWQHTEQTLSRFQADLTIDSTRLSIAQIDLILNYL